MDQDFLRTKGEYLISTDKKRLDLDYIHEYLCNQSYWAPGIPLETVRKSIEGCLCFGIYFESGQVGFARVTSDMATFAWLGDVFVDQKHRGHGLGKWLMESILSHPDLQGLRNWMLGTRDAQGLYAQFGFKPLPAPERIMMKMDPDIYKKKPSPPGSSRPGG
jgi:GNAT superfamily N-acetyltransferase